MDVVFRYSYSMVVVALIALGAPPATGRCHNYQQQEDGPPDLGQA